VPAQVVIELVTRNEAGANSASHRLQLALAYERANVVDGAAELEGDLLHGERLGPSHRRSIAVEAAK
jgi:hypothetical protein